MGDLAPSVRDADLLAAFSAHYAAAYEAHVVTDATTGRPKGFGFVRFSDEAQRDEAIHGLGGVALHGRALRLSVASRRTAPQGGGAGAAGAAPQAFTQVRFPARTLTRLCASVRRAGRALARQRLTCGCVRAG